MSNPPKPLTCTPRPGRRTGADRRRDLVRALLHSFYRGRRRGARRSGDFDAEHYSDVIHPRLAVFAVAIMLLSSADCLFTLLLLQFGASEVNPLMEALINTDSTLFVATKLALTAVCVLVIVTHRHFRFFQLRGCHVLYGVFAMYLGLFSYQVTLLTA